MPATKTPEAPPKIGGSLNDPEVNQMRKLVPIVGPLLAAVVALVPIVGPLLAAVVA